MTLRGEFETGDEAKRRGLPAAGRTQKRHEAALFDLDADIVDCHNIAAAYFADEDLAEVIQYEEQSRLLNWFLQVGLYLGLPVTQF